MWRKIMRYYTEHQHNPDKYPEWRNTIEWSEFMDGLKAWINGIFVGDDSILGNVFLFFLNNPCLAFLLYCGMAFGAVALLHRSFRASHIGF